MKQWRALLGVLMLWAASSCGDTIGAYHECIDGADNDGDGLIDSQDPGCSRNIYSESPDPPVYSVCNDLIDNDSDGLVDFPADPGCTSATDNSEDNIVRAQCNDGIDNDRDGHIDFPYDPGCLYALADSELDACPSGDQCPECGNGRDDDGDGTIDYPDDLGCNSAADNDESASIVTGCGTDVLVLELPDDGVAVGNARSQAGGVLVSRCGGTGQEIVYSLTLTAPRAMWLSTDFPETSLDTVLYVRSSCADSQTELGCNDDTRDLTSTLMLDRVEPDDYYIIVDAHSGVSEGNFRLEVVTYTPHGDACDLVMPDCAPGLVCRVLDENATVETCELPACSDGLDNDSDGSTDFPADPGCTDRTDNDESDACPGGPGCPQCSNGVDDDGDGLTDFPGDTGCVSASDNGELGTCFAGLPLETLPDGGATGMTPPPGAGSNFIPSCSTATTSTESVWHYPLTRDLASLTFTTEGSAGDTVTSVRYASCGNAAAEVGCHNIQNTGEPITVTSPARGNYFIFVDGDFVSGIPYVLNVRGTIRPGDACEPADTRFVCTAGYGCNPGSSTCVPTGCNNGMDDDGDGFADYPADPGCATPSDADEADDCPTGPGCPQCGNGIDDDGDGFIDYPLDLGCEAASVNSELDECLPGVLFGVLTNAGTSGTTPVSSAGSNFTPSCHTSTQSTERPFAYRLQRNLASLTFTTEGSSGDTVTSVRYAECGNPAAELGCLNVQNGGEAITVPAPQQGDYFVFVDGDFVSGIDFVLNVRGTIPAGEACDPASTQFVCTGGSVCEPGSLTCETAICANGLDDDGDGLIDFPADPGCGTASGTTEDDACPAGTGCPQCGNGMDDDGDGFIDYPGDVGCQSAGDAAEADLCVAGVPLLTLTDAGTAGVTPPASAGSQSTPSCHTSTTSTEVEYVYVLDRTLSSLTFTTEGSPGDTVLAVRYNDCGNLAAEVGCLNIQNGGEPVTVDDPAHGHYYVFVDGDFISGITYVLNVRGTIAPGQSCDPANTQFTCEAGYACDMVLQNCEPALCNNGIDDDGDGQGDFPADPGCTSSSDDDEEDTCPDGQPGASCPACGNGVDDDGDGAVDYPTDLGCDSSSDPSEIDYCILGVPVLGLTDTGAAGVTPPSSTGSDFQGSCNTSTTSTEVVYHYDLDRPLSSLTFTTEGSSGDTVTYVRYGTCDSPAAELGCLNVQNGGEAITVPAPQQGDYFVFVDGDFVSGIDFVLNVRGTIPAGEACDPASTQFVCTGGSVCEPGSLTCETAICANGLDDDGDGLIDFPADPGCVSASGTTEDDACPGGAGCPQCGNGIDDDGDGFIDYPGDVGCQSAGDADEADLCAPGVPLLTLTDAGTAGVTPPASAGSQFTPSCHTSTTSTEVEYVYVLDRTLSSLTFTTEGSPGDTVLAVRYNDCGNLAAEVGCLNIQNGGEPVTVDDPAHGHYYVFVDGDFISGITYVLNVRGTIAPGQSCDPANTQFTCEAGYACDMVLQNCEPALCNNGIDDDGDGQGDFPADPGCTSSSDDDEEDTCPDGQPGASCPACGNGVDDDGDGAVDYPADPGCDSSSDPSEIDYCILGVPVLGLTDAGAAGVTPPAGMDSDFQGSCTTSPASTEVVYHYDLDRPLSSITFTTQGSSGDTVTYVRYGMCDSPAAELGCLNVQNGGEAITVQAPQQGDYFVFVDGDFVSGISYVLSVAGTIPGGSACAPGDTRFVCDAGFFCDGATLSCTAAECNNGLDDDGDGTIDFPADPGCVAIDDPSELDDCPAGPGCPACGDDIDNDGDGTIDFPADTGCASAADGTELGFCIPGSTIDYLPDTGVTGTTPPAGTGSSFQGSCNSSTTATERVFHYVNVRDLASLSFTTEGSPGDTVTYVRYSDCGSPAAELGCQNQPAGGEEVTVMAPQLGDYFVFVDGSGVAGIDFELNVHGAIGLGGPCDPAYTQFACDTGMLCEPTMLLCRATQCADGIDNDADGQIDELDPECADADDDSEKPAPMPFDL